MPHARHNLRTPRASQLRSQQLLAASIKQQAVYVSASSSNMQCCAACNLKILFHPRSPYSGLFLLLARGTSRNASVLSTSVACTEGTASSTGNTYFSVSNAMSPQDSREKKTQPLVSCFGRSKPAWVRWLHAHRLTLGCGLCLKPSGIPAALGMGQLFTAAGRAGRGGFGAGSQAELLLSLPWEGIGIYRH